MARMKRESEHVVEVKMEGVPSIRLDSEHGWKGTPLIELSIDRHSSTLLSRIEAGDTSDVLRHFALNGSLKAYPCDE